jgi:hypothetical protein
VVAAFATEPVAVTTNVVQSAAAANADTIGTSDTDLAVSFIFHTFETPPGNAGRGGYDDLGARHGDRCGDTGSQCVR